MDIEKEISNSDAKRKTPVVLMWGYLPGASQQRLPLLFPTAVQFLDSGESWKDVCGGGCGFALAISESGKLITWGSTDDQGQSYLTAGKHEETPKEFSLPTEAPIVKAAAGWAHCVSVTDQGYVYTWGWKECVPSGTISHNFIAGGIDEGDAVEKQISVVTEQGLTPIVSPRSPSTKSTLSMESHPDNKKPEGEPTKRRRTPPAKQEVESSIPTDETLSAPPCLVALDPGVKVTSVAAGGRHTLALSDVGQVWGWGYGGEGQLGLGSRIKLVASPHLIPCFELSLNGKQRSSINSATPAQKDLGSYIKSIACGGRHSAVITDSGTLLTFGWGMYGQCGQGNTNDVLRPTAVASLSGTGIKAVAAGLWHMVCICSDGRVHAFGGNQFGQLGLGITSADQAETLPRLLDAPILENNVAKTVSCGARHSALLTDDGKVYCWGWNKYGQLGLGDAIDRSSPAQVPIEGFITKSIDCGWWHTLSLAETLP